LALRKPSRAGGRPPDPLSAFDRRADEAIVSAVADLESFDTDFVGPRHRLRESLLLKLFLGAGPGQAVLNAGAGQGSFSLLLQQRGFEVTSLDASPEAVELLRRRVRGAVLQADVGELPFADDAFDAAVLGEVLEHIEDDQVALHEVMRVLRPGGVVAISVPANPAHFGPSDEWAGHVRRYTRDGLLSLAESEGLKVERCKAWGFPFSTLYHRHLYEPRLQRVGAKQLSRASGGPALRALGLVLATDRLFVGIERGALGYLLVGRSG
jgi:ubiquinone/menaquinone biosynthesis C-methylase UbiE